MNILCLGDSLTYGYGVGRADTWCTLATQLTGHEFINRGVNGATTGDMLEQPLFGHELCVMGGLNDLFMGMDVAVPLRHLRLIVERAQALNIRPTVGVPMAFSPELTDGWCEGPVDMGWVRTSYAEFCEALRRQCAHSGIRVIDFRPVIGPEHLSFDGIHLNRLGHRRMAETVAAFWPALR